MSSITRPSVTMIDRRTEGPVTIGARCYFWNGTETIVHRLTVEDVRRVERYRSRQPQQHAHLVAEIAAADRADCQRYEREARWRRTAAAMVAMNTARTGMALVAAAKAAA